jgi:hypothetical protein
MHLLASLSFAAAAVTPTPPGITMVIFYMSMVPGFVVGAIAGRDIGWGIFQLLVLAFGFWQYWKWTEEVSNGVRMIGIYILYVCLNVTAMMVFLFYSAISRGQSGWLWPLAGLALAVGIAVLTTQIIRGYPRRGN